MKVDELLTKAKDGLETKLVYGEPYEVDGVTVIVASTVGTGGGGRNSHDEKGRRGDLRRDAAGQAQVPRRGTGLTGEHSRTARAGPGPLPRVARLRPARAA